MFFGIYAQSAPVRLAPGWLEGREVIAVFEDPQAVKPSYLMWLEWTGGRISFIPDYRYVPYLVNDPELVLALAAAPPGDGTAHECAVLHRAVEHARTFLGPLRGPCTHTCSWRLNFEQTATARAR